jgi:8-oxo-dGTP pyrophosphatase MutT (NUDIX family)
MEKKKRIRPVALCVFRRGDKIFVAEGHDAKTNKTFYRPIGGGIDFGEQAIDTVRREVQEEIAAAVSNLVYLGTLENIFVYQGETGHEICVMFDGTFVDELRNVDDYVVVGSDDGNIVYTAMWKSLDFFRDGHAPLYPGGLLELLDKG